MSKQASGIIPEGDLPRSSTKLRAMVAPDWWVLPLLKTREGTSVLEQEGSRQISPVPLCGVVTAERTRTRERGNEPDKGSRHKAMSYVPKLKTW